ncbi:MAG TPA: hypothetical protein PKZ32_12350 [Candidatus Melainabacteria bacterium]|nr:hypothetical protein [Candidatus Melainabacteria bacterium]
MDGIAQSKNVFGRTQQAVLHSLVVLPAIAALMAIPAQCQNYSGPGQSDQAAQSEQYPDSMPASETPNSTPETGESGLSSDNMSEGGIDQDNSANPPLPEAPPPQLPGASDSGPAPLSNADSAAGTSSEEINAAKNPNQAKGDRQLIESLRDVFPVNGNPLKDLFTPQPQFVTPQTLMNPQPAHPKAGEANPLKGLFTPQPQYVTPQTLLNPEPSPPAGEINHLKGVFTAQPQYPTPQTLMNPHPLPRYYVKERLPEHFFEKNSAGKSAAVDKAETALGPSKPTDISAAAIGHPLRQAMLLINSAHEEDAIALIDRFLVQYPGNFQARYVKAVALVRLRRLGDARSEYKTILQFSRDIALRKLAQEGINKLDE